MDIETLVRHLWTPEAVSFSAPLNLQVPFDHDQTCVVQTHSTFHTTFCQAHYLIL